MFLHLRCAFSLVPYPFSFSFPLLRLWRLCHVREACRGGSKVPVIQIVLGGMHSFF